jgi:hypothetical protein
MIREPVAKGKRVHCQGVEHSPDVACTICRPFLRAMVTEAYESGDPERFFKAMSELYPIRAYEAGRVRDSSGVVRDVMKEAMDDVRLLLEMLKKGRSQ